MLSAFDPETKKLLESGLIGKKKNKEIQRIDDTW